MIGQQKNNIILYHQNYYLIKKPVNHFLKSRCKKKTQLRIISLVGERDKIFIHQLL